MDNHRQAHRVISRVSANRTGREVSGVNIFRIENGQITEIWNHRDDLSILEQIGAVRLSG